MTRAHRRHGFYERGPRARRNRTLVEVHGECTRAIEIARRTMTDFALEAAHRRMPTEALVGRVLDAIARDDLFAALLDR